MDPAPLEQLWIKVYSEYRPRWIQVDVCEGAWDDLRLSAEGHQSLHIKKQFILGIMPTNS